MSTGKTRRYRLLVVDDNRAIHEDFRKILTPDLGITDLDAIEADLFGKSIEVSDRLDFSIESAFQGQEGLEMVKKALDEGRPYSLAFIDMRMPPGWSGIETIEAIWEADPDQQVVICSAYSDHSWAEISKRLGNSDRLLILKKPFDNVEILQMAYAMSRKCILAREAKKPRQSGNLTDLKEINDGVKLLQQSFDEFKKRLHVVLNELAQATEPQSQKLLHQLRNTVEFAELERRIPDAFNRLESALQRLGSSGNGHKQTRH